MLFGELVLGTTKSWNESNTHKRLMAFILVTHLADSNNLRLLYFFLSTRMTVQHRLLVIRSYFSCTRSIHVQLNISPYTCIKLHRAATAAAAHGSTGESQDWRFMFLKYLFNSSAQRIIIHLDDLKYKWHYLCTLN